MQTQFTPEHIWGDARTVPTLRRLHALVWVCWWLVTGPTRPGAAQDCPSPELGWHLGSLPPEAVDTACADAAQPAADTPDTDARVAEDDPVLSDNQPPFSEGLPSDAEPQTPDVSEQERMLEIERKLLEDDDPELIGTLDLIAQYQTAREAWNDARATREEIVLRTIAAYGEDDYRVVDARLAAAYVEGLQQFTPAERRELSEAEALTGRAGQLYFQGRYVEATEIAERVVQMYRSVLGERHLEYTAMSLSFLSALYVAQGDFARAEPLFQQEMDIRRNIQGESHPEFVGTLNNLATMYKDQGDLAKAEPLFRQTLEIRKEILGERHPDYAASLNNLATLYYAQGDFSRAEQLLQQALEIQKEVLGERHPKYAASLNNLAVLFKRQGDYALAEPLLRQALEIRREVLGERHPDYATSLNNLAGLYQSQRDYTRAEPLYRQALEIRKYVLGERHPDYAMSLNNLAYVCDAQGDYAQAGSLYQEALEIQKAVLGERHPSYAASLNNLAILVHRQGDHARAEALFREALEIVTDGRGDGHPRMAESLNNLALTLTNLNRTSEGLPLSRHAVEITVALLEATSVRQSERQQLAMVHQADWCTFSLLSLAHLSDSTADAVYPLLLPYKGQVFIRQRAIQQLRQTVQSAPDSEVAEAFLVLTDRVRELDRLAKLTPDPDALEDHGVRLEELTVDIERQQQTLASLSADYRESQEAAALTPAELAALLPADAALIDVREYSQYLPDDEEHATGRWERQYVVFITRRDVAVTVVWLGPAEPINAAVHGWRKRFGMGLSAEAGVELRRLVWEPLEAHLNGITTVLVSPDGELNALPWGALPGREAGIFLIEERAFVIAPVPLALPELLERPGDAEIQPSLLAIGDVDYASDPGAMQRTTTTRGAIAPRGDDGLWNWSALNNTRIEVELIEAAFQRRFRDAPMTLLRNGEATEQQFRAAAAGASFIHLATHGYFAPDSLKSVLSATRQDERSLSLFTQQDVSGWHPGLLSGIVLAGANQPPALDCDDGILTALEVAQLDLSGVELVTLSACETGLGQTSGGEGVLGLQRSLQMAGARTTITSLWKVDDHATRIFMERFYDNLWERDLRRGEALREAQLWMLREGESTVERSAKERGSTRLYDDLDDAGRVSPYYWAAFVLSGDWR